MKPQFKKTGWIFFPSGFAGWIITIVYGGISLATLAWIDSVYNSLFFSLVRFFPYFMGFTVIWYWVAYNLSGKTK
ncbi:MAG TPA: hypothetical protein P5257_10515 [Bacteroidales bacterium]|nr:hypothetical protein [Bacteroidales bacterium]HRR94005.1 hypothetical protein [Bacteroidales bacterium]HRT90540.1 hypothetical protein [Bacteroidales bacterium]